MWPAGLLLLLALHDTEHDIRDRLQPPPTPVHVPQGSRQGSDYQ